MESVVTTKGGATVYAIDTQHFEEYLTYTDVQAGLNVLGIIVHIDPNRTTRFHSRQGPCTWTGL